MYIKHKSIHCKRKRIQNIRVYIAKDKDKKIKMQGRQLTR
jgi:hypothetical protein